MGDHVHAVHGHQLCRRFVPGGCRSVTRFVPFEGLGIEDHVDNLPEAGYADLAVNWLIEEKEKERKQGR